MRLVFAIIDATRESRSWLLALAIVVPVFAGGCATYNGAPLDKSGAATKATRTDWPTAALPLFTLVAELPKDEDDLVRLFGVNLLDYDVVPVQVFVQNNSKSSHFEVDSRNIEFKLLGSNAGAGLERISAKDVYLRVHFSQWRSFFPWLLGIIPGIFSSMDIAEANGRMERDYAGKELDDSLYLRAGARADPEGGVVFYRPAGDGDLEDIDFRRGELIVPVKCVPGSAEEEKTLDKNFEARLSFLKI